MALTNWRTLVRSRLVAEMNDYRAANPGDLVAVHPLRPADLTSRTPCAYVSPGTETFSHSGQIRFRDSSPTVTIVGRRWEDSETWEDVDLVADRVINWFSQHPRAISSNTLVEPTSAEPVELEQNGAVFPSVVITLGRTSIQEGVTS